MKRDWDCIRAILRALEAREDAGGCVHPGAVTGWSEDVVSYHTHLLEQAGLVEAICKNQPNQRLFCMARNLTWAGHELLDKLASQTLWNRITACARDKSIALSFEAIGVLARKAIEALP
ncbi:MAG: DUF2513 domain-containing protein [Proteobacteria bacterium]|nr:DUF2513 domain-containing protein [Pseudomonadota bacterium]